jgi:hypothetical protein
MPSTRALLLAMTLGAAAGAIGALWTTLEDSKGLVLPDTAPRQRAQDGSEIAVVRAR